MAGRLFGRVKTMVQPAQPRPEDERARLAAARELEKTGGKATTVLTSGLAAPMPRTPEVRAPRTVITG